MPFDPDAYLKQAPNGQSFDPDTYLSGKPQKPATPEGWHVNVPGLMALTPLGTVASAAKAVDLAKHPSLETVKNDFKEGWKNITTPLLSAPDVDTAKLPDLPFAGVANPRLLGHVWNATHQAIESFESPLAIATIPVGGELAGAAKGGSKLAAATLKGMSGAFAAISGYATAQQAPETLRLLRDPNASIDDKGKAIVSEAANATMTLLGALGVVHKFVPEAAKQLQGAHIEDAPGKVVDAAGSVADPEAREALVQAANHIAEVAGMPPTEVKPAPPLELLPTGNTSPVMTLHRAGDTTESGIKPWSSWTSEMETAEAYTDNPGFGGKTIRTVQVPEGKVLDISLRNRSGLRKLAEKLGFQPEVGEQWMDNGWQYPWEESSKVKEALEASEYDWIRYEDDFPEGATTMVPIKDVRLLSEQRTGIDETLAEPPIGKPPKESPGTKTTSPVEGPKMPPADMTYGIAARVTEARADAGVVEPIEPGEGIAPKASVERGRQLLSEGVSPEEALARFQKTGAIRADDVALVRAKGEQLARKASEAAMKYGAQSEEYKAAAAADSDWLKAVKPMQTEWAKIGAAQQGETALDTGDFHSLATEFKRISGRDFTDREAVEAEKIANEVKGAQDAAEEAKAKVKKAVRDEKPTGEAGKVWKRAKELLDAGEDDFDDIRHKIATDLGMPVEDVTKVLAGPKTIRVITNDMYSKMAQRRHLTQQAEYWLRKQAMPGWERFARAIPSVFFKAKVFGHGTVGMITHAGMNVFDPTQWATYWPEFFKQFKLIGWHDQGAFHEMAMQDLVREPNYVTARRAGLANAVNKPMDDYQRGFMGKLGLSGNRGFDALKIYRQARFSQAWNRFTPEMRTPEMARALADSINHSTGYVRANFPQTASAFIFAPKLEGSRWAFLIGDPIRAGKTFANWSNASEAERMFAVRDLKQKAVMAGTYIGLLAANEGLLQATGSNQSINVTDPRKPDFMAFKAGGMQLGIVSPLLGSIRYMVNMLRAAQGDRYAAEKRDTRFEQMSTVTVKYVRGKASPFGSFATDVATQADYQNRPLPFSNDKVPAYLRREGVGKYTYPEYAFEQLAPIPAEEVIKEIWTDQGMSEDRAARWLQVIATAAIMGGTGARLSPDTGLEDRRRGNLRNPNFSRR